MKPIRPALAAARIWAVIILIGPLFFFLLYYLYELIPGHIAPLRNRQTPDYLEMYSLLLLAGIILAIVPFLITWAMLFFWNKKNLPARMMSERLLLLNLLFAVCGGVTFMVSTELYDPFIQAVLVFGPYFLAGVLGTVLVLGRPW